MSDTQTLPLLPGGQSSDDMRPIDGEYENGVVPFLQDRPWADPMMAAGPMTKRLAIIAGMASRVRSMHSHYGDMLAQSSAYAETASDSALRWVRPTSENPQTRGRKPNVLWDGLRVSKDSMGINQEAWEHLRSTGVARPAYYSDDLPAGSSYGGGSKGEDRYTQRGIEFVAETLDTMMRLSEFATLAYRLDNRIALNKACAKACSLMSRLACDARTNDAFREMKLANPNAHLSKLSGADRAKRERRGHHWATDVDKTYRNDSAAGVARYAGRGGEAYFANTHSISEDAILSALESDGYDEPIKD